MSRSGPALQTVVLAPILVLLVVAGLALYLLVLRTVSAYADASIRNTLDALRHTALIIADAEVDRQNREGRVENARAEAVYQLDARLRLESFARDQSIGIAIAAAGAPDFATGLPAEDSEALFDASASLPSEPVSAPSGASYYVAVASFSPWNWRILVAKDAASFQALLRQVRMIYGGTALVLALTAALLYAGVRQLVVRPIYEIAEDFSKGMAPRYRGVRELEVLSSSIGDMLASLQAKTLHLETTLTSMSDAISVFDANLRLVAWNPQFQALYRYPDSLLREGLPFSEMLRFNAERGDYGAGDHAAQVADMVERARTLTPPIFDVDRADGTSVEVRRAPMPGGGFVTTYTDITHRKQRALLTAANEAKAQFLENMSHDLRKPAAAIVEEAQLLLAAARHGPADDPVRTGAEMMRSDATHLLSLIDELLDMSRIEAGQVTPNLSRQAIASLALQAARVVRPAAEAKGLALQFRIDPVLSAETDGRVVTRILVNLMGNAVEYTERGSVTVTAARDAGHLLFEVADTGPGIPPEKLDVIFEKFKRLETTAGLTRPGTGLGLGLPISRQLARLLGGDVTVSSRPGEGSTFTLRVPDPSKESA
ncbi:MAG: PAS-domain containing protein [Alsobacter sp.]